jgi:hypothetical protein
VTLAHAGSQVLWCYEDDMILVLHDSARYIDVLFNSLDDLLAGRRSLEEDQLELVEPQLREPSSALSYSAPEYSESRYPSDRL